MDMRCLVPIVTAMISLMSTLTSAAGDDFQTLETASMDYTFEVNTLPSFTSSAVNDDVTCCNGVLGYASDNVSLNYPCQFRPCCNKSDTQAVVPVDFALGFRFQCMPRSNVQTMCYVSGSEVRTSNNDPDFIPRACCPGSQFHIELNHWYAALVVKCVAIEEDDAVS